MENSNKKFITFGFMVVGILIALVVNVLLDTAAAVTTGSVSRFLSGDLIHHGLPVVVGLGLFMGLQFNHKVTAWADEVAAEIRKVVWPSRKDTTAMTIVVCIMLIISGAVLGLMDVVSGSVIDWLVHMNFGNIF